MTALAGSRRHALKIRAIAIERVGVGQRVRCVRSEITRITGPQADHGKTPAYLSCTHDSPPGRACQPGTSTTAKYGASLSAFATSGIIFSSLIVPRST